MALTPGSTLGNYEIGAPLGAGGMGEVYRAHDPRLKREVALKVLPPRLAQDEGALQRFRREAQLLASLHHVHIAAVYGFEDDAAQPALVMELVEGETLAERLRPGAVPVAEALAWARQLAEALEFAHENGVIHRDLKPANIKLTPGDEIKVLDFGLAKALAMDRSSVDLANSPTLSAVATINGAILGTAAYMAPEQARGKPVDRRADIWAFGAVFYEMLTGQRAFDGETTTDVLANVIHAEPDWTRLPATLPASARDLLQRCLRKDVRQRQQSMGDARLALEQIGHGPAPGPAATDRRLRPGTGLAVIGAVGLVALASGWWLSRVPAPAPMRFRAVTAFAGVQRQPALSPDGRSVAFVSNRDGAYNVYVTLLGGGNLIQITKGIEAKAHPAWSTDGAELAYAALNESGLWDIWEVAALGGEPRLLLRDAADPAWSPDGKTLAYYKPSTGALWTSQPDGTASRLLAPPTDRGFGHDAEPRFSPDGRALAFVRAAEGPYGTLAVINLADGKTRTLTPTFHSMILSPAWSPDGSTIYFASSQGGALNVWRTSANGHGKPMQVTAGQGEDAELDLSSDGTRLAFATFRTSSKIAEVDLTHGDEQTPTILTPDPARDQLAPQFSPDGRRLTYFSNLKGVELEQIWTANADGSGAAPLVKDSCENIFPRWSPDGQRIYYACVSARAVRTVSAAGGASDFLAPIADWHVDVGSNGDLLLLDNNGVPHLNRFDPRARQLRALPPLPPGPPIVLARWSPDESSAAYLRHAQFDADPAAGVWVTDFQHPPRQIFRGWVDAFERGPDRRIFIAADHANLRATLWTVAWDGSGLTKLPLTLPQPFDYWGGEGRSLFSVSPDKRHLAFAFDDILQANIGLITFGR